MTLKFNMVAIIQIVFQRTKWTDVCFAISSKIGHWENQIKSYWLLNLETEQSKVGIEKIPDPTFLGKCNISDKNLSLILCSVLWDF